MAYTAIWPNTGELTRRITISAWQSTPNIDGINIDESFTDSIARWAKVDPVRGGLNWDGMQIDEDPTHIITVPYGKAQTNEAFGTKPDDLSGQKIIRWNGHRYRILRATDLNGAQKYTQLLCKDLGAFAS